MVSVEINELAKKESCNVKFRPWVGRQYENGGILGKRVLVLGASHYCGDFGSGDCTRCGSDKGPLGRCWYFTEDVINEMLYRYDSSEKWMQTFLCFERAVMGKELDQAEREAFWHSIAFYNFLQNATSGPRRTVQTDCYALSGAAFEEVLHILIPDRIILWGKSLYRMIPDLNGHHSCFEIPEGKVDVWNYPIVDKVVPALNVVHPSTAEGKRWEYWHKFYVSFLD